MKNSEKSINEIRFKKLRKELVDLKIKIEESPLFDGILKQLKQDLKIIQEKQNSLLNLKQELLRKDKIKEELQGLEDLINLLKQKEKIEVDLQSLKRYNEQLIEEININHKKIEDILNENESVKNKLIDEIQESQLIVKSLMKHIETKNNLISDLNTNIKIVDKNLDEKRIKIRQSLDIIVNLQNWRDSIWRRVIVVLTIGLFCSKKSVINKREKECKKLGEMFKKKQKLIVEQKERLEQIDVLNRQVEEHKKNIDYNKKELNNTTSQLNNFNQSNPNTKKVEKLEEANNKKQILLSKTKEKISKLQKELSTVSKVTIGNSKTLNRLLA